MKTVTLSMCGCYYVPSVEARGTQMHLPQVDLHAHTIVISTSSRTVLTQKFVNNLAVDVKECTYVFPLYDGVSVVGFTCRIGSRVITGSVKEKLKAREDYDVAVRRGETAGLLEQGATSDVFITSLGNIPAGEELLVTITYIGSLKYDFGADGIRFTMPTMISPRYDQDTMRENEPTVSKGRFAITVDIKMPEDTPLREVRSPSHPISVTLGRTSDSELQTPHLSRASATLSLGTCTLDKDFVLEMIIQDSGRSQAFLEDHSTILGQRAIMATFLQPHVQQSKPEVIFVADQSGSMRGARTKTLVAALRVFLKSLPVGIKFNICYFGKHHSFLFPKSQVYDQNSLVKALKSLDQLDGVYGGTETLRAVKASIESRDREQPLSLILATDGDIWQQQDLFDYLNDSVASCKKSLRVFALGIGNSVSSALIEGVARAGNGFAQSVGEGEKLDGKVVRMLRGALTPDFGALTLEIQYQKDGEEGDEFVMVERVTDSLRMLAFDEEDWMDAEFDEGPAHTAETRASGRKNVESSEIDGEDRRSNLPAVPAPKFMQIPLIIPPLYPFSRTSVFVLISPDAAHGAIKSIVLKGSSTEEPFILDVPVEVLREAGETIHQLAAKKAITELEEGRGWLTHAKDEKGVSIREKYSGHFKSIVEREAVRLGIQYQIAGKFTSFVATEADPEAPGDTVSRKAGIIEGPRSNPPGIHTQCSQSYPFKKKRSGFSSRGPLASNPDLALPLSKSWRSRAPPAPTSEVYIAVPAETDDTFQKIVALQAFEGYWNLDAPLLEILGLGPRHTAPREVDAKVWASVLAVTFLEVKMAGEKESWVMMVDKAREWLKGMGKGKEDSLEEKWILAKRLITNVGLKV